MDLLAQAVKTLFFHLLHLLVEVAVVATKQMVYQAVRVVVRAVTLLDTLLALEILHQPRHHKAIMVEMAQLLVSMVLAVAVVLAQ